MTIIIANTKGVWADRHTESARASYYTGFYSKKIHAISDDCTYACTGSIVKAEHYGLIYRNFKESLISGTPFIRLEGQNSDLHVFVYGGKVYFIKGASNNLELLDDPDDIVIGGSVEDLGYLLHYDGLSPTDIIKWASSVSNSVSAAHDHSPAEVI